MTCTFKPEDFQFIATIGKSKVKHATYRTSGGCLRTACGMFAIFPGETERWNLSKSREFDVTCKQCRRTMGLIENERKDRTVNTKQLVDVSAYFKYDIGDVVIVRAKSKLTYVEREITARGLNFFTGGHEVIYTVKNTLFTKFYKVDQCDIVGVK